MQKSLIAKLKDLIPDCFTAAGPPVDWKRIESEYADLVLPLQKTEQDKEWHGEGNVWTHTKMVAESLIRSPSWAPLDETAKIRLFLAALLHDLGKPVTTRTEDGHIISPKHPRAGAQEARLFLWNRFGLNTDPALIRFREEIVSLIRYHPLPYHCFESSDPLRDAVRFSLLGKNGELAALSAADFRGRIADDTDQSLEKVELFRMFAEENGILGRPYPFASQHSKAGYFSGRLNHPAEILYDDTWGEIVFLSGLPASGKDAYIKKHYADYRIVSLDAWRKRLKIGWTEDQSPVAEAARQEAAALLRQKIPFVWNATFLRQDFRRSAIQLCAQYGAKVRMIWLEASFDELHRRNAQRAEPVAESAYEKLSRRMEPPTVLEAENLEINPDWKTECGE